MGNHFLIFAVTFVFFAPVVYGQQKCIRGDVITVKGTGKVLVRTTIAMIDLGVEARAKTAVEAQKKMAASSTRLVNYLKSKMVSKLQTTGVSLSTEYRYPQGKPREIIGYIAKTTVKFEASISSSGAILDGSVRNGANEISQVRLKGSEQAISVARRSAIQDAIKDARLKAVIAANSAGRNVGRAVSIDVSGGSVSAPRRFSRKVARAALADTTPIVAGEQTVQATVTVIYSLT